MAQIDLRKADVYLKDGYTAAGTINQPGGYPSTTTTIAISGITMPIVNGSTFQIGGTGTVYTISSVVGGSTPTSLTFTPGLSTRALDGATVPVTISGLLVNNVAGYTSGTTMAVDGYSGTIANGTQFTVVGDTAGTHTISSSVGGGTPTSITFTPSITGSVADDAAITLITSGGVVNSPSESPQLGDTSITVTGFTAAIPVGATFVIAGDTTQYSIVSVTGGSTPTAFSFTPPLTQNESSGAAVTVGPNILKVKVGEGNLTFNAKRNMIYVREKRSIVDGFVMTGDDEPMDVKLDMIWEFLSSDTAEPPTMEEAILQEGAASGWVTSGADPCEPFAIDIEVIYTPPCSGVKAERILLKEYRWESLDHDLKAGTLATSGKCKILTPVTTRVNQPATP